ETAMPLCTHVGSSSSMPKTSPDCPFMVSMCLFGFLGQHTFADWIFSGNFRRFPSLKLVLSEGGVAWIPATIARMDRDIDRKDLVAASFDGGDIDDLLTGDPSAIDAVVDNRHALDFSVLEMFRDHVFACMLADDYGWQAIEELGS